MEARAGDETRRAYIAGHTEAEITALIAAEVALKIPERQERGVRHIDDLWRIEDFMNALTNEGITIGKAECPMQ